MPYTFENSEALLKNLKDAAPYISAAERFASFKGFVYDKRINIACTSEKVTVLRFHEYNLFLSLHVQDSIRQPHQNSPLQPNARFVCWKSISNSATIHGRNTNQEAHTVNLS